MRGNNHKRMQAAKCPLRAHFAADAARLDVLSERVEE